MCWKWLVVGEVGCIVFSPNGCLGHSTHEPRVHRMAACESVNTQGDWRYVTAQVRRSATDAESVSEVLSNDSCLRPWHTTCYYHSSERSVVVCLNASMKNCSHDAHWYVTEGV